MTLLRKVLNLLQDNILGILQLLNLYLDLTNILENLSNIHFSKCNIFKYFIYLLAALFTIFFFIYQITFYLFNFIAYLQFDCFIHILHFKFDLLYLRHLLLLFLSIILHSIIQILQLFTEAILEFIQFFKCILTALCYFNIKITPYFILQINYTWFLILQLLFKISFDFTDLILYLCILFISKHISLWLLHYLILQLINNHHVFFHKLICLLNIF
jgi:hypothetical protein